MCGRFALTLPPDAMRRLFRYPEQPNFPARYNIAPTQPIAIVRESLDHTPHFMLVRWGLIPSWVKDPSAMSLILNARAETAAEKPSFRGALRHHRCLIPANGFYEWRRQGDDKRPFFICRRDGKPMAFAGISDHWLGADGSEIDTAAVLTTVANRLMAPIHDRMPVIVDEKDWSVWLNCSDYSPKYVAPLMSPADDDLLEAIPVSDRVNAVRNDDAGLIEPLAEPMVVETKTPPKTSRTPPEQGSLF
ncbi:SOS response-associated peptidase [Oryzibacter oryziterrae]|uniref:SOS response-associated peptidase n=1 Tax=Oryzibacter oryziterrae TaxID=2766474 RepID=UPI001F30E6E4|nr:SOS response-associated peptidase [Oryzibacter oryziterrae]